MRLRWLVLLLLVPLAATEMMPHCKDEEMACFINVLKNSGPKIDDVSDDTTVSDVRLEIRPYSDKTALIRLKTKQAPIKVRYQGETTPIFGCELDGKNVRHSDGTTKLLDSSPWETTGIACEFLHVTTQSQLFDTGKTIEIVYGSGTVVPGTSAVIMSQINELKKCDMDWLTNTFDDPNFVYSEPDKRFNEVACTTGKLVYEEETGQEAQEAGGVVCEPVDPAASAATKTWRYVIYKNKKDKAAKDSSKAVFATESTKINVACRVPVCAQCKVSPTCSDPPEKCPKVSTPANSCSALTCDGGRFNFNGGPAQIANASCGRNPDENAEEDQMYRWFHGTTALDSATCADSVPCPKLTPDAEKPQPNVTDAAIVCPGSSINIDTDGTSTQAKRITCEGKSGKWFNEGGSVVADNAVLSCLAVEAPPAAPQTGGMSGLESAALAIGGCIILAVLAIIAYCLICKPRMDKKRKANQKTKAAPEKTESKSAQDGLKTALPVGYVPPPAPPTSSDRKPGGNDPEPLVEKTMIAHTPDSKPKSLMMKTAMLAAPEPGQTTADAFGPALKTENMFPEGAASDEEAQAKRAAEEAAAAKKDPKKEASDGSEPRPIRFGKDGNLLPPDHRDSKSIEGKSGEKTETFKECKMEEPKPAETGPKPRVFPLDAKEEKIRKGATVKPSEYPTLADVGSDWEDFNEEKAKAAGNMEAGKKKNRGKTLEFAAKTKTVPTAVTPDVPGAKNSVERTQQTRTRNTVDNGKDDDMGNLVTQLDTTVEQKEADKKKK